MAVPRRLTAKAHEEGFGVRIASPVSRHRKITDMTAVRQDVARLRGEPTKSPGHSSQNDGLNSTSTVKISSRPISMAKAAINLASGVMLAKL